MIQLHLDTLTGPGTLAYQPDDDRALLIMPARASELTADQCLDLARRLRNAALVLGATEMLPQAARLRAMGIEPVLDVHAGGRV